MQKEVKADFLFDHSFLPKNASVNIPNYKINEYLVNGKLVPWTGKFCTVNTPIMYQSDTKPIPIGEYPMLDGPTCVSVVKAAKDAYDSGCGVWPTMTAGKRIEAVEKFLGGLKKKRSQIIDLIIWEICKNSTAAAKEFDRTVQYVEETINELKKLENGDSSFLTEEGIVAQIRRAPLGVVLCCGPFNYPFNETYTTLIPSLIMGNTLVVKLPRTGVLCHYPTYELFRDCFPPGVVNIVTGSGRETLSPMMETGEFDVFAFIGTSKAADAVQKLHPKPHRLRVCLGLEAKNPAIVLKSADLDVAVKQCVLGSLSYNGQRCTAIKIIFVQESIASEFLERFTKEVDKLGMGLPWEKNVEITPLPEPGKPDYLKDLIEDAISKGAKVVNSRYGVDRTLVAPTVLYPVNPSMKVYVEEQFGPVVPVVTFKKRVDILEYLKLSPYGQQAALFGTNSKKIASYIDVLVNCVCRVNINCQCQRGPDKFPFTGRKDSAYGTLSVYDALRMFSIRTFVATTNAPPNTDIIKDIVKSNTSQFLRLDYIF